MINFARYFFLITGFIWLGYGIACAIFPEIIGTLTGIGMDNWAADLEVRTWYLVTELGLGILAYYGWKEPGRYLEINIRVWLPVFFVMVAFRIVGTAAADYTFVLQPGAEHLPYAYHMGTAYVYEIPSLLVLIYLWLKRADLIEELAR